jgi:cell division protein FtsZ
VRKDAFERLREPSRRRILIIGVGESGNNIVNRLMETGVAGAKCVGVNADFRHFGVSNATKKGRTTIEESESRAIKLLNNVDVVFVTASLNGVTGAAAAPAIAKIARGKGAVVVGVMTTQFETEEERTEHAIVALEDMQRACDTVVVVDSNKIIEGLPRLPPSEAFKVADHALANLIKGIVETISAPSLIKLDFADFKNVVRKGGFAVVRIGESDAPNRAEEAVRNALGNALLDIDYPEATGALVHISGDNQMTIEEANRVGEIVTEIIGNKASVVWGAKVDSKTEGFLKVTLVMTGMRSPYILSWFGSIMPKLYNLESSYAEPEKALPIDLSLDQIENFGE